MGLRTRSWVVGILVGSIVATAIVGYLHEADIFLEPANPIMHLLKDWIFIIVPLLPISYLIARLMNKLKEVKWR